MADILQVPDNSGNSMLPYAMMANGGMNNWMNNPFAYLMFLPFMYGMAGNGWGGNGRGGALAGADAALGATTAAGVQNLGNQVQNLGNQINDNANFGQLGTSIEGVKSQLGDINVGMVGGFANVAQDINNVANSLQSVGCDVKSAILQQGADNRLSTCQQTNTILMGNQALTNTVQNGFTQLGYQLQTGLCDAKSNSTANTQRIIDTLTNKWQGDSNAIITQLQDKLATLEQTNALIAALGGTAATAPAGRTTTAS